MQMGSEVTRQGDLDLVWREYVLTGGRQPEGFRCMRTKAGDHIIQVVASGDEWERKREGVITPFPVLPGRVGGYRATATAPKISSLVFTL